MNGGLILDLACGAPHAVSSLLLGLQEGSVRMRENLLVIERLTGS